LDNSKTHTSKKSYSTYGKSKIEMIFTIPYIIIYNAVEYIFNNMKDTYRSSGIENM
jgi:hypothetical protein